MRVTDVDEGEPPDLALVRFIAIITPALGAPSPTKDENAPLPHAERSRNAKYDNGSKIGLTGQAFDRRSNTRTNVHRR